MANKENNYAEWLFAQECKFIAGSASSSYMPEANLPEVAFVGRSNVGKSSLINKITNRNGLARVSHTPGRTKQLNFFSLGEKLMLVDLPGYGYAKAPKHEVAGWNRLIYQYLKGRPSLHRVCLLIDSRHGTKPSDESVMDLLDEVAVNYQIILTKSDKCTKEEIEQISLVIKEKCKKHSALHPEIIVTSSRFGGEGVLKLHQELADITLL